MATLNIYWDISRKLSRYRRHLWVYVIGRMLYARFRYGCGAEAYELRRAHDRPLGALVDFTPLMEHNKQLLRLTPTMARGTVDNKFAFEKACAAHDLPCVRTVGIIRAHTEEKSLPADIPLASTAEELAALWHSLPDGDYILKPVDTGHGWGVCLLHKSGDMVATGPSSSFTPEAVISACRNQTYTRNGFLIQERLRPHSDLLPLMPEPGLGTLRCVTAVTQSGEILIPWIVIKIPGSGQVTDNFSAATTGTIVSLVDVRTGQLGIGYGRTEAVPVVSPVAYHPTTNVRISGFSIPLFADVLTLLKRSARVFADSPTLGWDVAITERGPVLLEMNWKWGQDILEAACDRGLRTELAALHAATQAPAPPRFQHA